MNSFINYVDKYHGQLTVLLSGFALIVLAVLIWVWYYNRKKYHHLKHQIPASVVKTYLDSIIQNSTALKSSLFRGGGLDIDPSNIPSVLPLSELSGSLSGSNVGDISGDDASLKAELSRLKAELLEKNNIIKDLDKSNVDLSGEVKSKQARIEELEKLLKQLQSSSAQSSGGDNSEIISKLQKEKDGLESRLKEYDLIADDIADLKRYRQENEQLKKALGESNLDLNESLSDASSADSVDDEISSEQVSEPTNQSTGSNEQEPVQESEVQDEFEAALDQVNKEEEDETPLDESAQVQINADSQEEADEEINTKSNESEVDESENEDKKDEDAKSPEDLLSEFEKMLG